MAFGSRTNDSVVDTNMIPIGLLKSVEIVQGGGAAVYGSDAMGGVVNCKSCEYRGERRSPVRAACGRSALPGVQRSRRAVRSAQSDRLPGRQSRPENEISDIVSYGFIFQPRFVQDLTLIVDRIEIDLENGLSYFEPLNFLATCFDSSPQPADICAISQRNEQGHVVSSRQYYMGVHAKF